MSFPKPFAGTAALALAVPLLSPVLAAEPQDTELEEVIVTGTLRQQSLQDVPASVTVLDAGTLRDAGQQHFQDVLALVPNLNWASGSSRPRYFQIRGTGEREQYEGAPNPSVGFVIDDVDFSGIGMPATLFDVQQIEVLRGPQGTRYGANALAGLIVVRSAEPRREAGYTVEAGVAEYGTRSLGASATGPVESLDSAWRLSVQKYESDGFMRNAALDRKDANGRDELTARLKWRSWVGEGGTLDITLLHADMDNGYDAWSLDGSRTTWSDEPGMDRQRSNAAALRLSLPMGANTLTAIASHAHSDLEYGYDYDWGSTEFWQPYFYQGADHWDRERRSTSGELRLASPVAQRSGELAWLLGAYALRLGENSQFDSAGEYVHPDPADPLCEPFCDWSDARSLDDRYAATTAALFGQLDGRIGGAWRWSAGLRVEQRRTRYRDTGEASSQPFRKRDRMLGGQLSLSRELGSEATAYGLLSRGYKAGGFNLGPLTDDAGRYFDPQSMWNLEAGLKRRLPRGGRAELVAFYQRHDDEQVRSGVQLFPGGPYEFITTNLDGAGYSTGIEGSIQYPLTRALVVGGSLGLLRSRTAQSFDDGGAPIPPRERAHAPQYTAAVNLTWRLPQGFFARVDVTAMDGFYFDVPTDHDQKSRAYALAHLKAGYETGRWSIHGWLRNALDKQYAVRGFYFGNDPRIGWADQLYTQRGDPRQAGITASLNF
ncbi:MAG: TonB-dependent receptor plug domain-containing protein [Pseudomonadota bacterium]|nr:TonB-dependent receptor plug domain-containing protein [Pseudomonadota bacterium]